MKPVLYLLFFFSSASFAQAPPALIEALTKTFPESSTEDGRWVFYPEKASIKPIEDEMLSSYIPHVVFYKVTMTNYLGYHINQGTGAVLFDTVKSQVEFIEPLWYGDISETLLKYVEKRSIDNRDDLHLFLDAVHGLMEVGSAYRFVLTDYGNNDADDDLFFDLVYASGDSYHTGGNGIVSEIQYTEEGIWRKVHVSVRNNKIQKYEYTNPAMEQ